MARRSSRGGIYLAALGGSLLLYEGLSEGAARADEAVPKLDLVYEAPPGCPSRVELEDQLRARVPAGWLSGPDKRRFAIRIVREESGYSGRLDVEGRGPEEPSVREIRAPTCRVVSTAIVVFLALALDPTTQQPEEAPSPGSSVPRHPTKRQAAPPDRSTEILWTWSSGYQLTHVRAPESAWGGRVYADLARVPPGKIGFSARLSWGFSDFTEAAPRSGRLEFRLRTVRAEGCARIPVPALPSLSFSPCGGIDIGTLSGSAPELSGPGHASTGWTAAAAIVRAGYSVLPWITIEAELGALVPFRRTSFELVDPIRTGYRPPAVLFEGALGVCVSARFY